MNGTRGSWHSSCGTWEADLSSGVSLAIPLQFGGPQPNAFGLPLAEAAPFRVGSFVGDVREGGSANCAVLRMCPHGNGTHTECVGHITRERIAIADCAPVGLLAALMLSVASVSRKQTDETYVVAGHEEDRVLTASALAAAYESVQMEGWNAEALILRTLPNASDKTNRQYSGSHPPYLTLEAAAFLREHHVQHVLVDIPSVDREEDEGKLAVHHLFWSTQDNDTPTQPEALRRTITEMIYVPDACRDGAYLLDLQVPPFGMDAAPSRPVVFPVQKR